MYTLGDFTSAIERLDLGKRPAIAHASLKHFGAIQGGAETLLQALLTAVNGLVMPTFTYKTMVTPLVGPPNNGIVYGTDRDNNRMAEFFIPNMPADPLMGILPEMLRQYPGALRTAHPILSFSGINADAALQSQTLTSPLEPINILAGQEGWVLFLGVDHTVNTSIHYAEKLAGRRQFVRWALTKKRIVECPGFPGCSDGFQQIEPYVRGYIRRVEVGQSFIEAIPLQRLFEVVITHIKLNPLDLLCQRADCERCNAVRKTL